MPASCRQPAHTHLEPIDVPLNGKSWRGIHRYSMFHRNIRTLRRRGQAAQPHRRAGALSQQCPIGLTNQASTMDAQKSIFMGALGQPRLTNPTLGVLVGAIASLISPYCPSSGGKRLFQGFWGRCGRPGGWTVTAYFDAGRESTRSRMPLNLGIRTGGLRLEAGIRRGMAGTRYRPLADLRCCIDRPFVSWPFRVATHRVCSRSSRGRP